MLHILTSDHKVVTDTFVGLYYVFVLPLILCIKISGWYKSIYFFILVYEVICFMVFAKGGYRWMITPEMLQQTPGVWYVDSRLYNSTWEPGLTLKITSFISKCLYWQTERQMWSTDGCQVRFLLG